jgi:CRP/FNR family transcriptional regulator, cyclic AMP receptor protein
VKTYPLDRYLEEHEFFRDLPFDDLALIAGCGKAVHFREGEVIAREGDPADRFYVVREGLVALAIHAPGSGSFVVDTAGPDQIVGVSWIFPPYRWQLDARAVETVRAIALDGACLRRKCEEDPRLGFALMKRFAGVLKRRLYSTRVRLLDVYGHGRTN